MHDRHLTVAARVRGFLSRCTSSRWASPAARVLLFALGLGALAIVGGAASAHPMGVDSAIAVAPRAIEARDAEAPRDPAALARASAAASPPAVTPPSTPPSLPAPGNAPAVGAPAASSADPPRCVREGAHARATPEDPVFLNAATVDDLHRLPGVGDKRAAAILELRAKQGRFHQVEDLLRVKGIGRASLRKLRPLVRLDPPPITAAAEGPSSPAPAATTRDAPPVRTP